MVSLKTLCAFLDEKLEVGIVQDYGTNGLQVDCGKNEIKKIGFAVDACLDTFIQAVEEGCDVLIVHHGLFWGGGIQSITGIVGARIRYLIENKLSLYAVHLPLDAHPEWGNNAYFVKHLKMQAVEPFALHKKTPTGYFGTIKSMELDQLVHSLTDLIPKDAFKVLPFSGKKVEKVGVVTGSGASALFECASLGIDTFLTGEFKHERVQEAKELGINVISMGHYSSEIGGVLTLKTVLEEYFQLPGAFLPAQTGF